MLVDEIQAPDRDYPTVCPTARLGEYGSGLDRERVREIVGPALPIYHIAAEHRLTRRLGEMLPARLNVFAAAARI